MSSTSLMLYLGYRSPSISVQNAAHIEKFMQAYRRVLNLLHERQAVACQQKSFDLTAFLQLPDWQNLPVDARDIFRDIQKNRKI